MDRIRTVRVVLAVVSLGAFLGASCSSTESEVVATQDIQAGFVATAGSSGSTRIEATLRSGAKDVELTGGDFLSATTTQPRTAVMIRRRLITDPQVFGVSYAREFPGNEKDTLIEITFDRHATGGISTRNSRVTLPTPFSLHWVSSPVTREPAALDFSRSSAEPRFVVWDPDAAPDFEAGDVLGFSITGTCIEPYSGVIDWEQGEAALELTNRLQDRPPPNDGQTCTVEVEMTLRRNGVVDPAFRAGTFVAEQVRVFSLLARP
ncbi:MAG TPA: hypothetical protein ENI85_17425 [Deltaproteobacteria bacterium]|nr:hypothetical protein [Deltaproteobacteria bacterium]